MHKPWPFTLFLDLDDGPDLCVFCMYGEEEIVKNILE